MNMIAGAQEQRHARRKLSNIKKSVAQNIQTKTQRVEKLTTKSVWADCIHCLVPYAEIPKLKLITMIIQSLLMSLGFASNIIAKMNTVKS